MSSQQEKEQALQERLQRRATIVAVVLRKFIGGFYAGRQELLAAARAAELAKLAKKGKRGKKAAKPAVDPKDKAAAAGKDKKGGKKGNPLTEAWLAFLADMDDRINKQKRVGLEDIYRGVAALEPKEREALGALLATSTKKVLPLASLNVNQHNVRSALMAASAALTRLGADAVPPASSPGLKLLARRAATAEQLLAHGFSAADALRAGCAVRDVVQAGKGDLRELREAQLQVQDILGTPGAADVASEVSDGPRGVARLREAGYCAAELVRCGVDNPWTLAHAGYGFKEMQTVGFTAQELRAAGFGAPGLQPPAVLGRSLQGLVRAQVSAIVPPLRRGAQAPAGNTRKSEAGGQPPALRQSDAGDPRQNAIVQRLSLRRAPVRVLSSGWKLLRKEVQ